MQNDPAVNAILDALEMAEGKLAPKKRLVVESAVLCFAENGFAATSTRMIADRADVAEATIFRHFGTKKAMLLRIAKPVIELLLAPAVTGETGNLLRDAGGDVRRFARLVMLSRLAFADKYAPFVQIMVQEFLLNAELRLMVRETMQGVFNDVLLKALEHFQGQGQLLPIPPERMLRMFISLLGGYYLNRSMLAPGDWDDEAEVEAILDLVLNGVGAKDRPRIREL